MSATHGADFLNNPIPTSDNVDVSPALSSLPRLDHHEKPIIDSSNGFPSSTNGTNTHGTSTNGTSNVKNSLVDGPVAQNVKAALGNTKSDFNSLSESKVTPDTKTATGQQLTTYHSFFYNLLTWKSPRATLVTFAANIALIFIARYFPLTKWLFKSLALAFGTTVAAELATKPFSTTGLTSHFRPRKYYVLPREAIDGLFSEIHELLNFFVLEFQRVLFVENVVLTASACIASAIALGLIKFMPLWGLTLVATSVIYLGPLVYVKNQDLIDSHIDHASQVVNIQATQVKDLTAQHTARATEAARGYAADFSTKASDFVGQARGSISGATNGATNGTTNGTTVGTTGGTTDGVSHQTYGN